MARIIGRVQRPNESMVDYAPLRCKRVARGLLKRKIRLFHKWMIARRGKVFAGIF